MIEGRLESVKEAGLPEQTKSLIFKSICEPYIGGVFRDAGELDLNVPIEDFDPTISHTSDFSRPFSK